ncbi:MAG: LPS export ABC transporter periplasmic protein LptC [Gammaproteobacteria bacterium]|nr:LPS export ABC transporter periplasmic protein LptC [Gammaproteobacteria bacterium]
MKNRGLLILVIIIILSLASNWFLENALKEEISSTDIRDEPDSYMLGATIRQFSQKGELQHIISASEFIHYSPSDVSRLVEPHIRLFSEDGGPPWEISSRQGEIRPKEAHQPETLELWGDVTANMSFAENDEIILEAERVSIVPHEKVVRTLSDVRIQNQWGITIAGGLIASLESQKYELLSSKTQRVQSVFKARSFSEHE